jgi:hypothetical protein
MARPRSSAPLRPRGSSLAPNRSSLWETIAVEAGRESELWAAALRPESEREEQAVFSPLSEERFAVGLETIYEGYLLHYGKPRLFRADDRDTRILLGDYLYAHGLVRIASLGDVEAVGALAELLSLCAHLRAEGLPGDGEAWATTVSALDGGAEGSDAARGQALALHAGRVE